MKRHATLTCHSDSSSVAVLISAALYWPSSQTYLPVCKCLFTEMALNAGWFRENICDGEARWCTTRPGKCCNLWPQQSWLWIQIHICRSLFSRKKAHKFSSRQVGEIISRFERKGFVLKGLKLWQTPEELAQVSPDESDQHLFAVCSSHKPRQLPHVGWCPWFGDFGRDCRIITLSWRRNHFIQSLSSISFPALWFAWYVLCFVPLHLW